MISDRRRFIVCGETLIDLVPDEQVAGDSFSTPWRALSAGGPMNTAVALARLGADAHFLGRISTDAFGRQLRAHLTDAGVALDLAVTSDQVTSLAVVSLDDKGHADYAFHFDRTANFDWRPRELPALTDTDWLHLGSLALVVPPGDGIVLDWVATVTAPISIDLNVRPSVIGDPDEYWRRIRPWLQQLGGRRSVVKASDEDVQFLAGAAALAGIGTGPGDWRAVVERWRSEFGLDLIVITRGEDGAGALDRDGWTDVPGFATEVADTVGAGDTFMAGLLDATVRQGASLAVALRRGAAAASIVCSRQGAQPPSAAEVDALVRRA